jgi:hypothetical protein
VLNLPYGGSGKTADASQMGALGRSRFREEIRSRRESFVPGEISARAPGQVTLALCLRRRRSGLTPRVRRQTPRGEGLGVNGKMVNGVAEGFISGPKLPKVR